MCIYTLQYIVRSLFNFAPSQKHEFSSKIDTVAKLFLLVINEMLQLLSRI